MLWESISGKLAERFSLRLFTPAAGFWGCGLFAWALSEDWHGSGGRVVRWFDSLSAAEQLIATVVALLGFVASAGIVDLLVPAVLRLLEGYWPRGFGWMREFLITARSRRINSVREKLKFLEEKRCHNTLRPGELLELTRIDRQLRRVPSLPELRMPTQLGDILRSGETWPRDKYGLDVVVCWPRLWLLLPKQARDDLAEARRSLDRSIAIGIWGTLLVVWTPLSWWVVPVTTIVLAGAYWRSLRAAEVFADLVESAFDVFRDSLYSRTGIRQPAGDDERPVGELLTQFLWRGEVSANSYAVLNRLPAEGNHRKPLGSDQSLI